MRAQETVTGVRNTGKEFGSPQRVIPCACGDNGAQGVCLKLEVFGIGPRAHLRPKTLCRFDRCRIAPAQRGETGKDHRTGDRVLLLARDMPFDVVGSLVTHDKGKLVLVTRIRDQGEREGDDRTPGLILGLVGVGGLAGTVIPVVLERIGVDPALASGAFVTTVTDIVGFFAFLGLAGVMLF